MLKKGSNIWTVRYKFFESQYLVVFTYIYYNICLADSKAPIFSHLSATLDGLASIRVYNAQNRFDNQNIEKINTNHKALFAMMQGIV